MNSLDETSNDATTISIKAREISTEILYDFAVGLNTRENSDLNDFVLRVKNLDFYERNVNFDPKSQDYLISKSRLIDRYFKIINGDQKWVKQ